MRCLLKVIILIGVILIAMLIGQAFITMIQMM